MHFSRTQTVLIGVLGAYVLATVLIWSPLLSSAREGLLTVAFLDVGQGDATLITTPSGARILVDGGKDTQVLRALGKYMSFWERRIDLVIATHPDADHVGGLLEVVKRFDVPVLVRPGVLHDTPASESLFQLVAKSDVREVLARRGDVYTFDDGVTLTVLFPDRDVSSFQPNDASVVLQVRYGEHEFMLTGDAPSAIEEYLVSLDRERLHSDVLKVGHHGSDTSSSELFVGYVDPTYAVVSRGCSNRYGHPHESVIDTFARFQVTLFDTCADATVVFESDGSLLRIKK